MTLTERLEGYIKTIELDGGSPVEIKQHYIVLSAEAGFYGTKSSYLLLPAEISHFLTDELGIDIGSHDVKKFCHLIIERAGETPCVKIVYDLKPRPQLWRNK
jgi:hypothetical protein